MTNILIVDSAATGEASVSRKLTRDLARRVAIDPGSRVTFRDVGLEPIPHLTEQTVDAIRKGATDSDAARRTVALSEKLIGEMGDADLIVIGAPMYNFGMASTLKTWFDHVIRAGITFRYTEAGPEGLLKGKRAIVVETRAGVYSNGAPSAAMDGQEPHIRTLLGFIGIDDVEFVRAEGLAFGPDAAEKAVGEALSKLEGLAEQELALAA